MTRPVAGERRAVASQRCQATSRGHIALTRCTAHVDGVRGDGIRAGHDLTGALAAAICDAECERGGSLSPRVHELCRSAQTEAARRRSERADLVAMTTMEEP